jgi:hypothetical protein
MKMGLVGEVQACMCRGMKARPLSIPPQAQAGPLTYTLEVMQGPALLALQTVGLLRSRAAGTGAKTCWVEGGSVEEGQVGRRPSCPCPVPHLWLPT